MAEISRDQFINDFSKAPLNAFEISQSTFFPNDAARDAAFKGALERFSYDWNRTPEGLGQFFDKFLDDAYEAPGQQRPGVALNVPRGVMTTFDALRDPRTLQLRSGPPIRGPELNVANNLLGARPAAQQWVDKQFPDLLRNSMNLIDRLVPASRGLPPLQVDIRQSYGGYVRGDFSGETTMGAQAHQFSVETSVTAGAFDPANTSRMMRHELGHVAAGRYFAANSRFMADHLEVRNRVLGKTPDQVAPEDSARYHHVDHTTRPYHELLADVASLSTSGDPLVSPGRSFAGGPRQSQRADDEHHTFDATRQWLWNNVYKGLENNPAARTEATTRAFATVTRFLDGHIDANPPRDWRTPAVAAALNTELIAQLQTTFQR